MAMIVFNMISLILEGVKGFIFNFPSGTPTSNQLPDIALVDADIRHPTVLIRDFILVEYFERQDLFYVRMNDNSLQDLMVISNFPFRFFLFKTTRTADLF